MGAPGSRRSSGDTGGSVRRVDVAGSQGLRLLCQAPAPAAPAAPPPEAALRLWGAVGGRCGGRSSHTEQSCDCVCRGQEACVWHATKPAHTRCLSSEHGASGEGACVGATSTQGWGLCKASPSPPLGSQ